MAVGKYPNQEDFTSEKTAKPYPASWIDRLTNLVEQLPGPSWGYYLGLGVILTAAQTAVLWIEGAAPVGTFEPILIFLALAITFIMAIIPYFDHRASNALETIHPVLVVKKDEYLTLRYQLINLPAFPSFLASVLTLFFVFFTELITGSAYQIEALVEYPLSMNLARATYLISWWFFGIFFTILFIS